MVLVCEAYLGNVGDYEPDGEADHVVLTREEVRRSRVRATTEDGRDVGVVVDRHLRDGDVVYDDGEVAVVVELESVEAFAVEVDALSPVEAVEFGHELGNAHGEMAVKNGTAYIPVNDARTLVNSLPDEIGVERIEVEPSVFDDSETEEGHDHPHPDSGDHSHSHDHTHGVETK